MAQGSIKRKISLLLIGGSAGSLEVLVRLLPLLRPDLALAIVLVLHRRPGESLLVQVLGDKTSWPVSEAEEKEPILPGHLYVAPADYHLLIEKDHTFSLDYSEKLHYSRPSIDATFETAALAYGSSMAGLLLSGANSDGALGLKAIRSAGGLTIAQNPEEASVGYMPKQAIDLGAAEYILTTKEMASFINSWTA